MHHLDSEDYQKCVAMIRDEKMEAVTVSTLQRRFRIGYTRASRYMEMLADDGIIERVATNGDVQSARVLHHTPTPMNNDIAKDAARIKRLAEGAALAILTADNDSSYSLTELQVVARPIQEALEAATTADKERIASLEGEVWKLKRDHISEHHTQRAIIAELRDQLAAKTQEGV